MLGHKAANFRITRPGSSTCGPGSPQHLLRPRRSERITRFRLFAIRVGNKLKYGLDLIVDGLGCLWLD